MIQANLPVVSVILPYYNDAEFLPVAIESVLNQTYKNWELILCNHATTDNCREIAHSYNDTRIKHIDMPRNEGAGGGLVFEAMLNAASGKYIKTLCADDMLLPDCLDILVDYMDGHPDVDFAFGNVEYIDKFGTDLKRSWFKSRRGFSTDDKECDLIRKYANGKSVLPYIGNISKREIFDNIEINKTFVMLFDMSLWLQLLCNGCKCSLIDKKIACYRIHPNQMSALNKAKLAEYVSGFEHVSFFMYLLKIKDINLAKKVFPNGRYVNKIHDERDLQFFIAYEMHARQYIMYDIVLNKMLNDDKVREHLMKSFGFGVRELRELRKKSFEPQKTPKNAKDAKIPELLFLILRRIFMFVTFSKYRHKKCDYSL